MEHVEASLAVKRCPVCAEEVQDEAVKCRYCGAQLMSDRVRRLLPRYGSLTEQQRADEWGRLSAQEQRELTAALEAAPKPDKVKDAGGTLVAVVGIIVLLWAMAADFSPVLLVLGAAVLGLGVAMRRKAKAAA